MPLTTICLTWTVQVPVEKLGGHVQLFETLVPAINTLRMCNRFGQGDEAHITKLPMELVHRIEEYYILNSINTHATEHKVAVDKDYRCWKGTCDISDHFEHPRLLEIYNAEMEERFARYGVCPCGCRKKYYEQDMEYEDRFKGRQRKKKCTLWATEVNQRVANVIEDLIHRRHAILDEYDIHHESRKFAWVARTSRVANDPHGRLDDIEALLKKYFGLELWINHYSMGQGMGEVGEPYRSTEAFIRLPWANSFSHLPQLEYVERSRRRAGPDISFPIAALPTPLLSEKSAARFERALNLLQLTAIDRKPQLRLLVKNKEGY